ncbi:hypothetical protein RUM43_012984 [Polyplax serrata]|uniref:Cationic amino acid transporter C-terminal domain-containing protein n=1 Tax=Polyplax serrata TaxID=468196 RepID=A0AAN8NWC3_POLSC
MREQREEGLPSRQTPTLHKKSLTPSSACYAEFGVRVPHTTGSAYMYSYVTVGEFIAFVIGWNMVLEYLIGTAACSCALSACLDVLANGRITNSTAETFGTMFGHPPDFLSFVITILMMLIMAAGVKKSLIFNNILNTINLAVWVFVMTAGLFYVDGDNWSQHKGFLPYGWSGVFTGAATCFYAFIGFDIIATTGEEAQNPKKSIPYAIVSSLIIILIAYVTSSMMLTLIGEYQSIWGPALAIPYDEVDSDSALVEMFGQVGAFNCKYIVAVGALAGLTVSMFGSMFPMPRIVYAMAQDGLIFKQLSHIWFLTGTPAFATLVSGLSAAFAALFLKLEILVEMMSIGTLLAYTLVSTCVLILRYQPHSTNLIELLPESLRTPIKGSPTKETLSNGQVCYGNQLRPTELKTALEESSLPSPYSQTSSDLNRQRIMVRRVTRSSPDSDDTYPGEEEEFGTKDDQFLVSDRSENKFYGSLPGATSCNTGTIGPTLGNLGRRFQTLTYLCPAIFPWVDTGPATTESGMFVIKMVAILYLLIFIFDLIIVAGLEDMGWATSFFLFLFFVGIVAVLLIISRKPQNKKTLMFMTPGLPFVPAIAVTVNIYLIFKLSILTLVRFTIWMTIGLIVYFKYGIKNSTLETEVDDSNDPENNQNIELTIPKTEEYRGGVFAPPSPPPTQPTTQDYTSRSGLFVADPMAFPTWDD